MILHRVPAFHGGLFSSVVGARGDLIVLLESCREGQIGGRDGAREENAAMPRLVENRGREGKRRGFGTCNWPAKGEG